jgi:hypothetical protein
MDGGNRGKKAACHGNVLPPGAPQVNPNGQNRCIQKAGIFTAKPQRSQRNAKKIKNKVGKTVKRVTDHSAIPMFINNELCDPLRPLRLCGKSNASLIRRHCPNGGIRFMSLTTACESPSLRG